MGKARQAARKARQAAAATIAIDSQVPPHCPACNATMVKRKARRGANAGAEFWGCSGYAICRGTRPL
jgi:restriction system protein